MALGFATHFNLPKHSYQMSAAVDHSGPSITAGPRSRQVSNVNEMVMPKQNHTCYSKQRNLWLRRKVVSVYGDLNAGQDAKSSRDLTISPI